MNKTQNRKIAERVAEIKEGQIYVCDTLTWNDGWEFDFPSMMLEPVIRTFESGLHHEQIVEDVLIDALVGGEFVSHSFDQCWGWRGYKLDVLRRRFKEAFNGKRFPVAQYIATRETIQIIKDEQGELTWKTISGPTDRIEAILEKGEA